MLGPIFTTYPLEHYFADPKFFRYFLNALGEIHFELPGVFEDNPVTGLVNSNLWTVPYELACYVSLVVLAALGIHRKRRIFLLIAIAASLVVPIFDITYTLHHTMNLSGRLLVVSFLAGATLCLYRDRIPHSVPLFAAMLFLSLGLLSIRPLDVLAVWPVAYVTVYLGLLTPKKVPLLFSGDYSYGIYLFAYPIQQALWLTPLGRFWWGNLLFAIALSFGYAAFSWRCVEKPVLDRKRAAVAFVEASVDRLRALPARVAALAATVAGRALTVGLSNDGFTEKAEPDQAE